MSRTIQQQYQDALQDIANWQRSFNELEQQLKEAEIIIDSVFKGCKYTAFGQAEEYLKKYRGEK